jgi:hypothetical protein
MIKKRIGLIDNLGNIDDFLINNFSSCTSTEIMNATGGNTGNIAFVYGAKKLLKNNFTRINWGTPREWVKDNIDLIVISCANQLGAHVDLEPWAKGLEEFAKPVALIGIGVQSDTKEIFPDIPVGTERFLKIVSDLRPDGAINITTRGEYSKSFLEKLGYKSYPAGCPSLHITDHKDLGLEILEFQKKNKPVKVGVAAGNPWHAKSSKLEKTLTDIVDNKLGAYILQHPELMISLAIGEMENLTENQLNGILAAYGEKFTKQELIDWYRRNAVLFIDIGNWIQFYKRFDLILGPRYHGVAIAVQAGRPGTVITIDTRTEELCDQTGIKKLDIDSALKLSEADLLDSCIWTDEDAQNLTQIKNLQHDLYIEFIRSLGL